MGGRGSSYGLMPRKQPKTLFLEYILDLEKRAREQRAPHGGLLCRSYSAALSSPRREPEQGQQSFPQRPRTPPDPPGQQGWEVGTGLTLDSPPPSKREKDGTPETLPTPRPLQAPELRTVGRTHGTLWADTGVASSLLPPSRAGQNGISLGRVIWR